MRASRASHTHTNTASGVGRTKGSKQNRIFRVTRGSMPRTKRSRPSGVCNVTFFWTLNEGDLKQHNPFCNILSFCSVNIVFGFGSLVW